MPVDVVMCVYRRLDRLAGTLRDLADQDVPVIVHIWDNSDDPHRVAALAADATVPVRVAGTGRNIGGAGRYEMVRRTRTLGDIVVFIDDDQLIPSHAIRTLTELAGPTRMAGCWSWQFTGPKYTTRRYATAGETAHYLGTGGLAVPTQLVRHPLIEACPQPWERVEDLWLSAVARHLDVDMVSAGFTLVEEDRENNQCHGLWDVKDEMATALLAAGFPASRFDLTGVVPAHR